MREVPIWCIAQGMAALTLGLLPSLPVRADIVLTLTDLQPQYASQLCWAAADAIAVNSFYTGANVCLVGKTAPFTVHPPGRTSQWVEAVFKMADVTNNAATGKLNFNQADVSGHMPGCVLNIENCSQSGTSILPGLTFHTKTNGDHLTWEEATQQIMGASTDGIPRGHPFLFQWQYPPKGSKPGGTHELVVIGYSEDSGQQLIVWDPLPVAKALPSPVDLCDSNPAQLTAKQQKKHTHRIPFTRYSDPESDMGVDAAHVLDQYDLRLPGALNAVLGPTPRVPQIKPAMVRQDSGALPSNLVKAMFNEPAQYSSPSETIGIPFPIIGLELEDLRVIDANPLELLTRKTSAVLFPIESHGEVVGSFLMLLRDGKWHRGGYSNTEITQLLVETRRNYAKKENLSLDTFYLVSIPGRAAFFAAHGRDAQAVLIPASSDPSINAEAEVPVPAAKMLSQVSTAIRRDDAIAAKSQADAGYRAR